MRLSVAVLLPLAAALVAGCADLPRNGEAAAQPRRPNIVFIVADDMGYGDLQSYGSPDTKTPFIDSLARDGVRFTQFYANGPECTPTRTAILTARYQQRVVGLECAIGTDDVGRYDDAIRLAEQGELGLPASEYTIVRGLKDAGYATAITGKWHLGYRDKFNPSAHGFDFAFYIEGGNCDYYRHTEETGRPVLRLNGEPIERDGYMTDLITNEAVAFIARQRSGTNGRDGDAAPFFLFVTYTAPHFPFQPPDFDTGVLHPKEHWNRGTRAEYVKLVDHLDKGVGLILQTLAAKGLADDTLVIFISDHGGTPESRNAPFSGHKGTTLEGGIRAPCLVRWPGRLPAGKVTDRPAMTFDLSASLLRIAEAKTPVGWSPDGVDILQDVADDAPVRDRPLFWRGRRGEATWRAVRDGDLKYITHQQGEGFREFLYDVREDPAESRDLTRSRVQDVRRMEAMLAAWEAEVEPAR